MSKIFRDLIKLIVGNICPPGYFCPAGSGNPNICPPGMFCAHFGLSSPSGNCTAGFYCLSGSVTPTEFECPSGHFCLAGTSLPEPCPKGTYYPGLKNSLKSNCISCLAGHYCEISGLAAVTGKCSPKYSTF